MVTCVGLEELEKTPQTLPQFPGVEPWPLDLLFILNYSPVY